MNKPIDPHSHWIQSADGLSSRNPAPDASPPRMPSHCVTMNVGGATHPLAAAVPQQEAGEPVWKVGEFVSSANRPVHVLMLAVGEKQIAEYAAHRDFIRWIATPQVSPPQARVPLTEKQVDALLHTKHFDKSYKLGAMRFPT